MYTVDLDVMHLHAYFTETSLVIPHLGTAKRISRRYFFLLFASIKKSLAVTHAPVWREVKKIRDENLYKTHIVNTTYNGTSLNTFRLKIKIKLRWMRSHLYTFVNSANQSYLQFHAPNAFESTSKAAGTALRLF